MRSNQSMDIGETCIDVFSMLRCHAGPEQNEKEIHDPELGRLLLKEVEKLLQRPLMDLLGEIPGEVFFTDTGHPDFNAIFIEVARRIYAEKNADFSIPARDFLTDMLPNLTTFQRAVTKERRRREG